MPTHRRNPVARSPLMRKGGAHVKSKTGQRTKNRQSTLYAVDEWYEEQDDQNTDKNNGEQGLPDLLVKRPLFQLYSLP